MNRKIDICRKCRFYGKDERTVLEKKVPMLTCGKSYLDTWRPAWNEKDYGERSMPEMCEYKFEMTMTEWNGDEEKA